jgi:hypothetical protein
MLPWVVQYSETKRNKTKIASGEIGNKEIYSFHSLELAVHDIIGFSHVQFEIYALKALKK